MTPITSACLEEAINLAECPPHCSHTHTDTHILPWHMGHGSSSTVLHTSVVVFNEAMSHVVCVCVLRHVLTAGRTSSTHRKTVKTTNCPTASVIATPVTWDRPNPSSPATEVHKHTLTHCIGSVVFFFFFGFSKLCQKGNWKVFWRCLFRNIVISPILSYTKRNKNDLYSHDALRGVWANL